MLSVTKAKKSYLTLCVDFFNKGKSLNGQEENLNEELGK